MDFSHLAGLLIEQNKQNLETNLVKFNSSSFKRRERVRTEEKIEWCSEGLDKSFADKNFVLASADANPDQCSILSCSNLSSSSKENDKDNASSVSFALAEENQS